MKRRSLLLLLCALYACITYGYSFKEGNIFYNITSSTNKTVEVTYGNNYGEYDYATVTIPDKVQHDGNIYYVTRIGNYAFAGCSGLGRVLFNEYITSVGDRAFSGCSAMSSITIPEKVTSIGNYAFSGCLNLTTVNIEDSKQTLSLGYGSMNGQNYGLFADCPLSRLYWGRPLSYNTSYGYSPVANQPLLDEITIGPNVTTITAYMFYGNTALSTITLPETVTTLGNHAFHGFTGLKSFTIPSHITSIGEYAFAGCTGLTSLIIPEQITSIADGTFSGCTGFTSFVIPKTVKSIGNYAFNGCTAMTGVTIEESEETLSLGYKNYHIFSSDPEGSGLFFDCPLTSVFVGRNLSYNTNKDYGYSPFANIETLTKAHFGNPIKTIQPYLFKDCKLLKMLQYNSKCAPTSVESYAFWGCTSLTETDIILPESVQTIGEGAFRACTSLEGYTIPNHITTIGNYAFMNCEKLKNIVIKPSVKSIGNYAFNGCVAMTGVTIEESEETLSLGYNNYHNYNSDPEGRGLFFDCPLTSVFIGRNLSYNTNKNYGYSPFANIETLTKAHFGNPIKTIQPYLFKDCKLLKTLQYNSNSAPTSVESYAFWGCTSLTETDIVLPESVETIDEGAFRYCTSLEGYTIPNHIKTVGNSAFMNCEKLKNIVIKPSVKSIGNYAFNGCTAMTGVTIEESEEILSLGYNNYHNYNSDPEGRGLFFDCPLTSVFIGRNLSYNTNKNYGYSPFANIETLTKAHFGNPIKTIQPYLFAGCTSLTTLQYNSNCKPTSIEKYAFWSCKSLKETDIVYPVSINTIGEGAFQYCTSLEGYTIPNHITTVGNYAFMNCEKLKNIVIKPSVKSIGNYAFNVCTAMTGVTIEESEETLSLGYNNYHNYNSDPEGRGLFFDCPLTSVFVGRNLSYNTNKDYGYSPFANIETLTKAHFGNPVTSIPNYLFLGNKKLSNVIFNESCQLQSVGKYAFDGCKILSTPQFPNTVTAFEEGAFRNCATFTDFDLPENLVTIGSYTFQNCAGLTKLTIPATTTSIGNYAYAGCTGITSIEMKDAEETLSLGYGADKGKGYGLFYDCPLEELYLGKTLSYEVKSDGSYGYSPFYKKETLTKITVGTKVSSLPYCVFFGTAIEELYVPSSVRTIHSSFVNECTKLKNVIILGATPPSIDKANTLLNNTAEGSKFYVFFPDAYKTTDPWKNYADRIAPICIFTDDFIYNGKSHSFAYQTEFPITLSNLEAEIEAGTYSKTIDVAYVTNGYHMEDVLKFEYTISKEAQQIQWDMPEGTLKVGDWIALTAKATSGLPVTYTAGSNGCVEIVEEDGIEYAVCKKGGTLTVTATQAGDNNYAAAESVTWTAEVVNPLSWTVLVDDKTFTLTEQVVDYGDKRTNGDGQAFYRAKLTLDVTTGGNTQTYNIDNEVYINDQDSDSPLCMVIDMTSNTMMVFVSSKSVNRDYKMDGYAWVSSLDNIAFTKEKVFTGKNWGWYSYFDKTKDSNITLYHFSYESYYGVQSVRNNDGTWTNKNTGSISPSYAIEQYKAHERILLIGNQSVIPGDANGDGLVNVTDIVATVNYIMEKPSDNFNEAAADLNGDGYINVTDIVKMVSIIMNGNGGSSRRAAATSSKLVINRNNIQLRNAENYIAAQFDINLSDGQSISNVVLNVSSDHDLYWKMVDANTYRVVVYSMTNAAFRANGDNLFNIFMNGGRATISNELLIKADGTTGIDAIRTEAENGNVYDMNGRQVKNPRKGVYIINGRKVVVK